MIEVNTLSGHSRMVYTLGWNSSGSYLASGSVDKSVRLWNVESTKATLDMRGHTDAIHHLGWDSTSDYRLATTAGDKTVRIWDCKVGHAVHTITLNDEYHNIHYSMDGVYIAVSNKSYISIIDTRKNTIVSQETSPNELSEVRFTKNNHLVLAAGHPTGYGMMDIKSFDTNTLSISNVQQVMAHSGACCCLDIDRNEKIIALGSMDSLVSIWDMEELYCIKSFAPSSSPVRSVALNHNGKYVASGTDALHIDVYQVDSGNTVGTIKLKSKIQHLSWHPSTSILAYVGDDADRGKRNGIIKLVSFDPKSTKI